MYLLARVLKNVLLCILKHGWDPGEFFFYQVGKGDIQPPTSTEFDATNEGTVENVVKEHYAMMGVCKIGSSTSTDRNTCGTWGSVTAA